MVGKRIGNYRVLRQIGRGGMGAVFEAIHDGIGKRVAVKVLHVQFAHDPHIAGRFFNEARAVTAIGHPGIVQVFDFGQIEGEPPYIVMEFLQGEPLSRRLKRTGRMPSMDALRLGRQMAAALAAAHARHVVHRDLKPGNVIIVPDPEAAGGERAKILDFGIAKMAQEVGHDEDDDDERDEATEFSTRTGVLMGTPAYMSPEQCRGAGNVDDRSDVYSLGILLYQMLCGRPPFIAEGDGEVLAMQIYEKPVPLLERAPEVQAEIAVLIDRMLAKSPQARPSMTQVAQEMEALGIKASGVMSAVFRPPTAELVTDSAQRSVAPFIGSAQSSVAPFIGSAQRSGAPFTDERQARHSGRPKATTGSPKAPPATPIDTGTPWDSGTLASTAAATRLSVPPPSGLGGGPAVSAPAASSIASGGVGAVAFLSTTSGHGTGERMRPVRRRLPLVVWTSLAGVGFMCGLVVLAYQCSPRPTQVAINPVRPPGQAGDPAPEAAPRPAVSPSLSPSSPRPQVTSLAPEANQEPAPAALTDPEGDRSPGKKGEPELTHRTMFHRTQPARPDPRLELRAKEIAAPPLHPPESADSKAQAQAPGPAPQAPPVAPVAPPLAVAPAPAVAAAGTNPPVAAAPKPPSVIRGDKLSGEMPHLPEWVKPSYRNQGPVRVIYKICINKDGKVDAVVPIGRGLPEANDGIIATLRQWTYKPQPIHVCLMETFKFVVD